MDESLPRRVWVARAWFCGPRLALGLVVLGTPVPGRSPMIQTVRAGWRGRARCQGAPGAEYPRWEPGGQAVRAGRRERSTRPDHGGLRLLRGVPIEVNARFCLPRIKEHFRSGCHAGELRADAPALFQRPTVDQLLDGALDPVTGVIYADDGQVVAAVGLELFGDPPRAEIAVLT